MSIRLSACRYGRLLICFSAHLPACLFACWSACLHLCPLARLSSCLAHSSLRPSVLAISLFKLTGALLDLFHNTLRAADMLIWEVSTTVSFPKQALSDHRPVHFQVNQRSRHSRRSVPMWVWKHPYFGEAFSAATDYFKVNSPEIHPIQPLHRLTKSIHAAAKAVGGWGSECPQHLIVTSSMFVLPLTVMADAGSGIM